MLVFCPQCSYEIDHETLRCPRCGLRHAGWRSKEWQDRLEKQSEERRLAAVGKVIQVSTMEWRGSGDSLESYPAHTCEPTGSLPRESVDVRITAVEKVGYSIKIDGVTLCCGKEMPVALNRIHNVGSLENIRTYFWGEDVPAPEWMR